ncbi:MAG: hypothetical protein GY754_35155 [bacterium]|nr:hypothetical protein [bacterium]
MKKRSNIILQIPALIIMMSLFSFLTCIGDLGTEFKRAANGCISMQSAAVSITDLVLTDWVSVPTYVSDTSGDANSIDALDIRELKLAYQTGDPKFYFFIQFSANLNTSYIYKIIITNLSNDNEILCTIQHITVWTAAIGGSFSATEIRDDSSFFEGSIDSSGISGLGSGEDFYVQVISVDNSGVEIDSTEKKCFTWPE